MSEELWFTHLLNSAFAGPVDATFRFLHVDALLRALHAPMVDPAAPITNGIATEIMVVLILVVFATWLARRLSVERPRAWQQTVEVAWTGLEQHGNEVIGHDSAPRYMNYLFSLLLFILIGNLLGLVPGFDSPTGVISVTVGLALTAFVYYHRVGIRHHKLGPYAKTFLGPIPAMAWLMVLVETVSHFARILSLSVRLMANMYAGEVITLIFLALLPVSGLIFMGLHVFVALLQTYIFVVLVMVYLSGALAEEH